MEQHTPIQEVDDAIEDKSKMNPEKSWALYLDHFIQTMVNKGRRPCDQNTL